MGRAANDNWPDDQILVVPDAVRGDSLWIDVQAEAQDQIGAALRAMYADPLQRPVSPQLTKLIHQIDNRLETSRHAG